MRTSRSVNALSAVALAFGATACGGLEPSHKDATAAGAATTVPASGSSGAGTTAAGTPTNGAAAAGATADATSTVKVTAAYTVPPIDLMILRSRRSHDDYIVSQRINTALPILAARLLNASPDINVIVLDNWWFNDPAQAPASGPDLRPVPIAPISDAGNHKNVLNTSDGTDIFSDSLATRIQNAGTRQGQNVQGTWAPFLTMAKTIEAIQKGQTGDDLRSFLRPNSRLAALFLDFDVDTPYEPYEVDDIKTKLGSWPGGFTASTLAPTADGCQYNDNPVMKTNPNSQVFRNATLKLAKLTSGSVGSICDKSYALFFDSFADAGLGLKWFAVTLPSAAKDDGIKSIMAGGVAIKDYRYWPGTTTLELPMTIPNGTDVTIEYVPLVAAQPVVGADNPDPSVPKDGEKVLSDAEKAFVATALPILNARCASCHNGRPFDTSASNAFASAMAHKAEILDRIQRATGADGVMPQGGWPAGSDADKAALISYFSK